MDRLCEYVMEHSYCWDAKCEYFENGVEMDCKTCLGSLIKEHDKNIRVYTIDEVLEIIRVSLGCDSSTMIRRIEMLKEQFDD